MFRREIGIHIKSFCLWTAALVVLMAGIAAAYPFLIDEKLYGSIDQLMGFFPPSLLKAFNMDIASISKASGWIKTEGAVFYTLIGALYAAVLGGTILVKEESEKTIEFLYSLPVSRARIVLSRYAAGMVFVALMPAIVTGATCLALYLTGDFAPSEMIPLLLSPALVFAASYSLSFALSSLMKRARAMTSLSFAIVFGSYAMYILGQLSEKAAFLKRASLFAICETREIVLGGAIPLESYLISGAIAMAGLLFALFVYQRKDLV